MEVTFGSRNVATDGAGSAWVFSQPLVDVQVSKFTTARWPSGLRRQTKVSTVFRAPMMFPTSSGLSGRGFESHSRQLFRPHSLRLFPDYILNSTLPCVAESIFSAG